MAIISIGDKCMWRGAWGTEEMKQAIIEGIEKCRPNEKYGMSVKSIVAEEKDSCVFTLDNGHWAYGSQIDPMKK